MSIKKRFVAELQVPIWVDYEYELSNYFPPVVENVEVSSPEIDQDILSQVLESWFKEVKDYLEDEILNEIKEERAAREGGY